MRTDLSVSLPGLPVLSVDYAELGSPGIPHAIVEWPSLGEKAEDELRAVGRALRYAEVFPKGANVNFYRLLPDGSVRLRTYERGVEDFTYACGTGTGSTALILTLKGGKESRSWLVHNPGGDLQAEVLRGPSGSVTDLYLTGPTNIVARGVITDENL